MLRKAQVQLIANFTAALKPDHLKAVEVGDKDHEHYLAHQMARGLDHVHAVLRRSVCPRFRRRGVQALPVWQIHASARADWLRNVRGWPLRHGRGDGVLAMRRRKLAGRDRIRLVQGDDEVRPDRVRDEGVHRHF